MAASQLRQLKLGFPHPLAQWGPWGMGAGGVTPSPETCNEESLKAIDESDATEEQKAAMRSTIARECTGGIKYDGGATMRGAGLARGLCPVPQLPPL